MQFRIITVLFSLVFILGSCGPKEGSWISFEYDEVKAYYYDNSIYEYPSPVVIDGKLNPTILNPEGEILNSKQVNYVGEVLNGNYSDENEISVADCYVPRHGIVFYKNDQIVAHTSICFQCNQIKSFPSSKMTDTDPLIKLFKELNVPIHPEEFPK